jgi:hypothetical protein
VLLTYFNGRYGVSVRYPASWRSEQLEQEGVWYRYFLGPPAGPERKPSVSATLLVGPLAGTLEDYAQTYLAGNTLASSREEGRDGAKGKSYEYSSADGKTRYTLLLLEEPLAAEDFVPQGTTTHPARSRVFGLYCQGPAAAFLDQRKALDEMARSLSLERPERYPERKEAKLGASLRLPPSWTETRRFGGGGMSLVQFVSPPLAMDRDGATVHASLSLTVEPIGEGGLEDFYGRARQKLGDAFQLLDHDRWRGGYADVLHTETPVAASQQKRYYQVAGGKGYTLACEARSDVFGLVQRWCDLIAGTLALGEAAGR